MWENNKKYYVVTFVSHNITILFQKLVINDKKKQFNTEKYTKVFHLLSNAPVLVIEIQERSKFRNQF